MRVLHVISSIDPNMGGPTTALIGLTAGQVRCGLNVSVLATALPGESLDAATTLRQVGVTVIVVKNAHGRLRRARGLARTSDEAVADADVVHIHALWEEVQHQAARAAWRRGVPYLVSSHGMLDPWSLRQSKWAKRLILTLRVRGNLNRAAALHFTSPNERKLVTRLGLRPRAIVEPNGVDLSEFAKLPPKGTFRARYPSIAERPIVLFFSRIHFKKGLDLLVPAFADIVSKPGTKPSRDAMLVIAGPDDGGYRAIVEAMVRRHGLDSRVVFTGMLQGEQRLAALGDADLFVLPSYQENFGIAVIEALAAGTPVIVSDQVNIYNEIAAGGVGGVATTEVGAWAGALARWLDDARLRQAAAEKARSFVNDRYDWNAIARRWAGHYRDLAQHRSSGLASAAPRRKR